MSATPVPQPADDDATGGQQFQVSNTAGGERKTTATFNLSRVDVLRPVIDHDPAASASSALGWSTTTDAPFIGEALRRAVQRTANEYEMVLVEPGGIGNPAVPPLTVGYAAATLGITKPQMEKLIGCGLVEVLGTTGGGHRRVHPAHVYGLALREAIGAPAPGDLALHLGPLNAEQEPAAHQRSHYGWHARAAAQGLSPQAIEDAWTGLWRVDPEPHVGAALIGDVAGFVVTLGTVTGYRRIAGRVRFTIDPPTPEITSRYAGRRFTARPGDMVQRLGAAGTA